MPTRLVIFDCDGTLVDSQLMIIAAMERAFAEQDLTPPPRTAVLGVVGLSLPDAIWHLAGHLDEPSVLRLSEGYKAAFGDLRQSKSYQDPLYDGARGAVLQLASEPGFLLGIATGKSRRGVDHILAREDLTPHFATIQTADDAPSKPHPGMIEQAMEEVGAGPEDTVMIGDTTFDMTMARHAGVAALGVAWGYHPVEQLRTAGAHHVCEDFAELLAQVAGRWPIDRAAE
ncbi:MAG: HAD-IA family hydrolase [Methyloligellaceae bacterium]